MGVDELYHKLEMKRRELEEAQRQLLQERKKVEAFVGQDVQMLTVRPVDMTQMSDTGHPVMGYNGSQELQQLQQLQSANPTIPPPASGEPLALGQAPGEGS